MSKDWTLQVIATSLPGTNPKVLQSALVVIDPLYAHSVAGLILCPVNEATGKQWRVVVLDKHGEEQWLSADVSNIKDGELYRVTATKEKSTVRIYVNGDLAGQLDSVTSTAKPVDFVSAFLMSRVNWTDLIAEPESGDCPWGAQVFRGAQGSVRRDHRKYRGPQLCRSSGKDHLRIRKHDVYIYFVSLSSRRTKLKMASSSKLNGKDLSRMFLFRSPRSGLEYRLSVMK